MEWKTPGRDFAGEAWEARLLDHGHGYVTVAVIVALSCLGGFFSNNTASPRIVTNRITMCTCRSCIKLTSPAFICEH
jgi:hypothetical protein